MIRQYELVERVQAYKPDANEVLLNKAYVYAMRKHGGQKRISGDPYFVNPLEVAAILTRMRLDETTIAVALLHDTLEDTTATREELDSLFGEEIGLLVEGVTKLKKLDFVSHKAIQAENLRKFLIAVCEDIRVLLVKFADRLHNMRTLDGLRRDKQIRIAEETMEIYAPLAGRIGMQDMREELEELAFRYMNMEAWQIVTNKLNETTARNRDLVLEIENLLVQALAKANIKGRVFGRQKKPWSIFTKMQTQALSFEQLCDIYGFRVIVDNPEDCYRVLGLVHQTWSMVPGRFKDYISTPKQNGYQSLHTTIVGPSRQRVELQIRTTEMDYLAEYGVAAHVIYKEKSQKITDESVSSSELYIYNSLRQIIQSLSEGANPEEFLEHTKLELFQDQVFCFTPKGKLISLPRGATPIDFAYAVHTEIGHCCIGVKINGRNMPLMSTLKNGDEVEILCAKDRTPPTAWEALAVTGRARSAIRRATRQVIRQQYHGLGIRLLQRSFTRNNKVFSLDDLALVVGRLARRDVDDILTAVGCGEISSRDVLKALYPDHKYERMASKQNDTKDTSRLVNLTNQIGVRFKIDSQNQDDNHLDFVLNEDIGLLEDSPKAIVPILGVNEDLPVRFGGGGAVPGDKIVGIVEAGVEIVIYPIQSSALTAYEKNPERWIDVRWDLDEEHAKRFAACLRVVLENTPGSLAKVSRIIADHDTNIKNMSFVSLASDFYELFIDLEVWDLTHLNLLISQLKLVNNVNEVRRIYDDRLVLQQNSL